MLLAPQMFFRNKFRLAATDSVQNESAPFHNLFNGAVTTGQVVLVFIMWVAVFVSMIYLEWHFFSLYNANSGQERTEIKKKITTSVVIILTIAASGSIVAMIIRLFAW